MFFHYGKSARATFAKVTIKDIYGYKEPRKPFHESQRFFENGEWYDAVILDAEFSGTRSGRQRLTLKLEVFVDMPDCRGPRHGFKLTQNLWGVKRDDKVNTKMMMKNKSDNFFDAIKMPELDYGQTPPDPEEIIGRPVRVRIYYITRDYSRAKSPENEREEVRYFGVADEDMWDCYMCGEC